jgi:glutamate-1-semialdehyde 2,1-aminomutase
MDELAPIGSVYQAGTLSGNPLATAAGLAVLELLDDAFYASLADRAAFLAAGLTTVLGEAGLAVQVPRVATLVGLFFSSAPVLDYEGAQAADVKMHAAYFHALLRRDVFLAPSAFEAVFVSGAHGWSELERTVELAAAAAVEVASGR